MTISTNYRHPASAANLAKRGREAILLAGALMLSACGGGGGGTVAPSGTPIVTFTSWSAVQPGTAVEVKGLGMQAVYEWNGAISRVGAQREIATSALLTFDANAALGTLFLASGSVSMDFPATQISSLNADRDFLVARNSANAAVISNPKNSAWNYQSFGVWETGRNASSGDLGVFSMGAPTAADAIPTVDGASFTGKVVGSYVNAVGQGHTVLADLNVDVNWAEHSLAMSTTNTRIAADGVNFGAEVTALNLPKADLANPALNTLSYQAGTNSFSGTLTTAGGLEGPSAGQFYGPNTQELGGVFFLKASSGVESYRGAYGAQQVAP